MTMIPEDPLDTAPNPRKPLTATWEPDPLPTAEVREPAPKESPTDFKRGQVVGKYLILHPLGRGGMGQVFAAYDSQLDRQVALKVLLGGSNRRRQARLLREAQALARINHPNVITLYDASTFEGQVFLAMELVAGKNLAQWLADDERSQEEIIGVFHRAGRGLAAAHDAGLVHRDFKPTNVMVGDDDRVLVLDFGLARGEESDHNSDHHSLTLDQLAAGVCAPQDSLGSSLTHTGSVLGTPQFMAPEQRSGGPVDSRADQFSFCVALHWALCGLLPSTSRRQEPANLAVSDRDPSSRPSSRANNESENGAGNNSKTLGNSSAPAVEKETLDRLPLELQDLLQRGLAEDPKDRFPSMHGLLESLSSQPTGGKGRRLALGLPIMIGLVIVYLVAMGGPNSDPCPPAEQHFEELWSPAQQLQLKQALLETGRPYATTTWPTIRDGIEQYRQRWLTMHRDTCEATHVRQEQSPELLDLRMACLHQRRAEVAALVALLTEEPELTIEQAAQSVLGLSPIELCADTRSLHAKDESPDEPEAQTQVKALRQDLAKVQALYAAHQFDRGLEALNKLLPAAEDLGYWPFLAEVRLRQGLLQEGKGNSSEAWQAYQQASWAAQAGGHLRVVAAAAVRLVRVAGFQQNQPTAARTIAEAARRQIERLSRPAGLRAELEDHLGLVHFRVGNYGAAAEQHRKAVSLAQEHLGDDHPLLAGSLIRLGNSLQQAGKVSAAESYLQQALALHRQHYGVNHPQFASSLERLAANRLAAGRFEEAHPPYRQAIEILRAADPSHPELVAMLTNLGISLAGLGRFDEALETYHQALQQHRRTATGSEGRLALLLLNMGSTRMLIHGADQQALDLLHEAREILQRLYSDTQHPYLAAIALNLGEWHIENQQPSRAEQFYRRALDIGRRALGEGHPNVAVALTGLGRAYNETERTDQAVPLLRQALALWQDLDPESTGAATAETRLELARSLWPTDRPRALDLAHQARADLSSTAGAHLRLLERVESWLRLHS